MARIKRFGATKLVRGNAVDEIMKHTQGKGVDVAIEAVGVRANV